MTEEMQVQAQTPIEVRPLPSAGEQFLVMIERAVRDTSVDVGKMQTLLDMREKVLKREAEIAFNESMVRLQHRIPDIFKTSEIKIRDTVQSKFAALENIDRAVRPLMSEEGFSVSYDSEPSGALTIWKCIISHSMGHHRTYCLPPIPSDTSGNKNAVQAMGSANSYARRYALCNALNIVTKGLDDDGHGSMPIITEQDVSNIYSLFDACEMSDKARASFLRVAGVDSVEKIPAHRIKDLMGELDAKLKLRRGK